MKLWQMMVNQSRGRGRHGDASGGEKPRNQVEALNPAPAKSETWYHLVPQNGLVLKLGCNPPPPLHLGFREKVECRAFFEIWASPCRCDEKCE